jgi:hypothetical protein
MSREGADLQIPFAEPLGSGLTFDEAVQYDAFASARDLCYGRPSG